MDKVLKSLLFCSGIYLCIYLLSSRQRSILTESWLPKPNAEVLPLLLCTGLFKMTQTLHHFTSLHFTLLFSSLHQHTLNKRLLRHHTHQQHSCLPSSNVGINVYLLSPTTAFRPLGAILTLPCCQISTAV